MKKRWIRFLSARNGATAIEYSLIAALLAVAAIGGVRLLGTKINSHYQYIYNSMS